MTTRKHDPDLAFHLDARDVLEPFGISLHGSTSGLFPLSGVSLYDSAGRYGRMDGVAWNAIRPLLVELAQRRKGAIHNDQ